MEWLIVEGPSSHFFFHQTTLFLESIALNNVMFSPTVAFNHSALFFFVFSPRRRAKEKSYTFKEHIFPDFFPHLRMGKSAENMMRAGDANRAIFRWPPILCLFQGQNKRTPFRKKQKKAIKDQRKISANRGEKYFYILY